MRENYLLIIFDISVTECVLSSAQKKVSPLLQEGNITILNIKDKKQIEIFNSWHTFKSLIIWILLATQARC